MSRGFACRSCGHERAAVVTSRKPAPLVVVRYRTCPACGWRVVTEERVSARPYHPRRKPAGAK